MKTSHLLPWRRVLLTTSLCWLTAASADTIPHATGIDASLIVTISDGDFIGQTYADGRLPAESLGHRDVLSVISIRPDGPRLRRVPVSNSVTAAPEVLALSPDGGTAFVAERLAEREPGMTLSRELKPGRRVFAVTLQGEAPAITDTAEVGSFPEALALRPDGRVLAVLSNTPDASLLQLLPVQSGRFGRAATFRLADLGISGQTAGPRGGVLATNVQWHPSGRWLAVNVTTQNRIAFFQVQQEAGTWSVQPWGAPVEVGVDPFVGRFTPDGSFYLTSNWGRNFQATSLEGRLPTTQSDLSVVRFDSTASGGRAPRHDRVGTSTATGNSAEGLTISPDGRFVATVNMRGTPFPPGSPRFQREASVTLLTLDPATGALTRLAEHTFEGVLPEGAAFDASGRHLLVTVFHGHADAGANSGPGLEVLRITRDGSPGLVRVGRIPLPHGVHHVAVFR